MASSEVTCVVRSVLGLRFLFLNPLGTLGRNAAKSRALSPWDHSLHATALDLACGPAGAMEPLL